MVYLFLAGKVWRGVSNQNIKNNVSIPNYMLDSDIKVYGKWLAATYAYLFNRFLFLLIKTLLVKSFFSELVWNHIISHSFTNNYKIVEEHPGRKYFSLITHLRDKCFQLKNNNRVLQ